MNKDLYYIEKMNGTNHDGPAWIGFIKKSKTGKTIYFNNKAFKKTGRGEYYDIETGDCYWISRIKKDGSDRHWAGHGIIMIDSKAVDIYKDFRNLTELKKSAYQIVDIIETRTPQDYYDIENEKLNK